MPGLGWQELVIILVIIIIIFGAGKLPEVGSALGKGVKEFKTEATEEALPAATTTATTSSTTIIPADRKADEIVADRRDLRADEI